MATDDDFAQTLAAARQIIGDDPGLNGLHTAIEIQAYAMNVAWGADPIEGVALARKYPAGSRSLQVVEIEFAKLRDDPAYRLYAAREGALEAARVAQESERQREYDSKRVAQESVVRH